MSSLSDYIPVEGDLVGYPIPAKAANNAIRACYNVIQGQLTNLNSTSITNSGAISTGTLAVSGSSTTTGITNTDGLSTTTLSVNGGSIHSPNVVFMTSTSSVISTSTTFSPVAALTISITPKLSTSLIKLNFYSSMRNTSGNTCYIDIHYAVVGKQKHQHHEVDDEQEKRLIEQELARMHF